MSFDQSRVLSSPQQVVAQMFKGSTSFHPSYSLLCSLPIFSPYLFSFLLLQQTSCCAKDFTGNIFFFAHTMLFLLIYLPDWTLFWISLLFLLPWLAFSSDSPGVPPSANAHELFRGFSFVAPSLTEEDYVKSKDNQSSKWVSLLHRLYIKHDTMKPWQHCYQVLYSQKGNWNAMLAGIFSGGKICQVF